MNYNSFLNKDYKNRRHFPEKKSNKPRALVIFFTILGLLSGGYLYSQGLIEAVSSEDDKVLSTKKATTKLDLPLPQQHPTSTVKETNHPTAKMVSKSNENVAGSIFTDRPENKDSKDFSPLTNKKTSLNVKNPLVKQVEKQKLLTSPKTIKSDEKIKTVVVKKGDTLSAIFKRLSLKADSLHKILNSSKEAKRLTRINPGQKIIFRLDNENNIKSIIYRIDKADSLVVTNENGIFTSKFESKEIETKKQFAANIINESLFKSASQAGLSSAMTMKLAHLFGWDIDFALDIRKGDSFALIYEEKYVEGQKINEGNIISAEFINQGKIHQLIRYTDASGRSDYYSPDGFSMRKAFLRTPVDFSRISSRFSLARKHPKLNLIRAHKGVDYAASKGTPIKASGDGKVIFKGRKGGYGKVVILQHGTKYSTLYAHMSSYKRKLRVGQKVAQGQTIGYVGSTGLATGPHLHYEFRVNGVHRNPLTVPLPNADPLPKKYRNDFNKVAETLLSQLKASKQSAIALND